MHQLDCSIEKGPDIKSQPVAGHDT